MTALGAKGRPMPSEVWFDEENSTQTTSQHRSCEHHLGMVVFF